jgi:hypothetical protein
MRAGNWELALRIGARFPELGEHGAAIVRGHEAYAHSRFYAQLGYDVEALKDKGRVALIARYGK